MLIQKNCLAVSFLLIHVLCTSAAVNYTYSDLVALGAECTGRDSCSRLLEPDDFFKRNCECDRLCSAFGDCCIDASEPRPYRNRMLSCMPFGATPNQGAYVISGCPRRTPSDTAAACARHDLSDPLLAAPVSTPGGASYRNAYCAACNRANLSSLVSWPVLVNCETLAPYNLSSEAVWSNLEREADGAWGVRFEGEFHDCDVLFDLPQGVRYYRLCRADVVSTCPDGWQGEEERALCEAYMAMVLTKEAAYHNPHCAICNGQNVQSLACDPDELLSRSRKNFSFALLLDVNRKNGDLVGVNQCPKGHKYDPFFKKCRNLVCAIPGYKLVGSKCEKA